MFRVKQLLFYMVEHFCGVIRYTNKYLKCLSLQHLPQIPRWLNHESKVTSAFNFVKLRDLEHKKANVRFGYDLVILDQPLLLSIKKIF
jgi:hypothetical protein